MTSIDIRPRDGISHRDIVSQRDDVSHCLDLARCLNVHRHVDVSQGIVNRPVDFSTPPEAAKLARINGELRRGAPDEVLLPEYRIPAERTTFECATAAERKMFVAQRNLLRPDLLAFLTPYALADYDKLGINLFIAPNLRGGYGLYGNEIVSVFSLDRGTLGKALLKDAVARGGRTLDCLDANGHLTRFYGSVGFVEVCRNPWSEKFAPPAWNYDRFGRPDLVVMKLAK